MPGQLFCLCHRLQKTIKKFDLMVAYANRSVYLIWSQIWAVVIFHENLSINNIIGICIVFFGSNGGAEI